MSNSDPERRTTTAAGREASAAPLPKGITPLRVWVLLSILALLIPLLLAMPLTQYLFFQAQIDKSREVMTRQSEGGIITAMRMLQRGYNLLQGAQQFDLGPALEDFSEAVRQAGEAPLAVDLGALKSVYGEDFDFYVIDADKGVVVMSTEQLDLGLDLSEFNDFWGNLKNQLEPGAMVTGPISQEANSGHLRHFAYLLTPDGRWVLEVGIRVDSFERELANMDYEQVSEELVRLDPSLERVRVFERHGYLDKHPENLQADQLALGRVLKAIEERRTLEFEDEESGKLVRYVFVDLTGKDGWPIFKVAEMTHSTAPQIMHMGDLIVQQVLIGLAFLFLGALAAVWLSSRITGPIKRIITDVDRIAAGEKDHQITVQSSNELRILEESISDMVRRNTEQLRELEQAEAEIAMHNQELEVANRELQEEMAARATIEGELRNSELLLRAFLDADTEGTILLDMDGYIVELNQVACERLGGKRSEIIGMNLHQHMEWEAFEHRLGMAHEAFCSGKPVRFEDEYRGSLLDIVLAPVFNEKGGVDYIAGHFSDLTQQHQVRAESQQLSAYFEQLFENSPLAIVVNDADGRVRGVNRAFEELFMFQFSELMGKRTLDIIVPVDKMDEALNIAERQQQGAMAQAETERKRKDGRLVHVHLLCFPIIIEEQREGSYMIYQDISERKQAEDRLLHQSFHDPLTGSPNRALLLDRLQRVMRRMQQRRLPLFALLYLDLDRFKVVNDSLGHQVGDQLLYEITTKLSDIVRSTDTVSRISGDEFAVLLDELDSPREAMAMAQRILNELNRPIRINDQDIFLSASIGVVVGSARHERPEFIVRDAEIAMYRAKGMGRNRIKLFQSDMREQAAEVLRLENDLRRAMENGEFLLHYQPIVDMRTGRLEAFEALLRWEHPEKGLVFPDEFIPVAEDSGLIIPMGMIVLEKACHQLRQWQQRYSSLSRLGISVNLSAKQFLSPQLKEQICSTVQAFDLDMECVKLEITESVVMENARFARGVLQRLKSLNLKLSIDDFGTGYSSLSYLRQFPVDTLKIDRSFVMRMDERDEDVEIVRAIISLAHNMSMEVVAEGVENGRHVAQLESMGCDFLQGYHFSRPMAVDKAEQYLAAAAGGIAPVFGSKNEPEN